MAEYQITCITKPNRTSPHEHITHVGNKLWNPKTITRERAIQLIDDGDSFFVTDPNTGKKAYVRIVTPGGGRDQYIQTYADGIPTDNLLSLPEC